MADTQRRVFRDDLVWELEAPQAEELSTHERRHGRVRSIAEQIVTFLDSGRLKVPMLPQAATEALALANNPQTSVRELEQIICADPAIAARVLAVANSSAYGNRHVRTLTQAIQRLGTGTIRDILYQAVAEAHIFRGRAGRALVRERDHAVAVATATRLVCTRLGLDAGYAFICGLLHDLGRTVLMQFLQTHEPPDTDGAELEAVVHRLHAFVGARVATNWGLPKLVAEACRRHHVYREWSSDPDNYSQIGNMVAVADRLAIHHGLGRPPVEVDLRGDRTYYDLGLDPATITEFVAALSSGAAAA